MDLFEVDSAFVILTIENFAVGRTRQKMGYTPRYGLFFGYDKMLLKTKSTVSRTNARKRRVVLRSVTRTARLVWKQTFQPFSLALLALSCSMVLWGIGYKVSLFQHPADSSGRHFPVAKAVFEQHRQDVGQTAPSTLRMQRHVRSQVDFGPDGNIKPLQSSTQVASGSAPLFTVRYRAVPYYNSAMPLRSPPVIVA